jgi:hypothetical protein
LKRLPCWVIAFLAVALIDAPLVAQGASTLGSNPCPALGRTFGPARPGTDAALCQAFETATRLGCDNSLFSSGPDCVAALSVLKKEREKASDRQSPVSKTAGTTGSSKALHWYAPRGMHCETYTFDPDKPGAAEEAYKSCDAKNKGKCVEHTGTAIQKC